MTRQHRKTPGQAGKAGRVRIIGGIWRGRNLEVPAESAGLRPTPNRVRETLFNWLQPYLVGARCLDLFAGTGALGFEAISRGAAEVCFVERERHVAMALERQLAVFGGTQVAQVIHMEAMRFLDTSSARKFDLLFLDPPFAMPIEPLCERLRAVMAPGAVVFVERPAEPGLPVWPGGEWLKNKVVASVAMGLLRQP